MFERDRFALKEWAAVVEALAAGRQTVLLRKGGVEEEGGEFRIEHPEFFLYPTFEHQHRRFIRPEFLGDFDRALAAQPPGEAVLVKAYAVIGADFAVRNLDTLRALGEFHIWNEDFLKMRLAYKPEKPSYLVALRVYTFPPVILPFRAEYRGCKSWVELDRELSTAGAEPALADAKFERALEAIASLAGREKAPVSTTQRPPPGLE
jgi:hypothetical protein